MIRKLLIANRGEIALRIIRTARAMGIRTVAVYSDVDRKMFHVEQADEAVHIGASPAAESYLDQRAILTAAHRTGADAIHPGYGFLSENPDFVEAVEKAGIAFVGPPARAMRAMGHKHEAKRLMRKAGVPVVPGYDGEDQSPEKLREEAGSIGYPVLIKPVAGGGGKGMRLVTSADQFAVQLAAARREAASAFGDDRMLIEKHLPAVRHIEVQIMADRHGNVIHLWERDCSAQRRHQKVIEEAPAAGLSEAMRQDMCAAAVKAARQVGYVGAGTVEFLVPKDTDSFYFIEMNTRLQVEHPVTEMITGLDLVALQLHVATGETLGIAQKEVGRQGHAIECRIYAEDPAQDFKPQTGAITALEVPQGEGLRFDCGVRRGDHVSAYYDAMIGKLIVHGAARETALMRLQTALALTHVAGLKTNLGFLARLLQSEDFAKAQIDTGFIDSSMDQLCSTRAPPLEVLVAAILGFEGWLSPGCPLSPFHALRSFQLWGSDSRTVRLLCDGATVETEFADWQGRFTISREGEMLAFTLHHVELPDVWLMREGMSARLLCHVDGGGLIIVAEDGTRYRLAREAVVVQGSGGEQDRLVIAPVPGLLTRFMVSSGEHVAEGDLVAVVEAMKTEFSLRAGAAGDITFFTEQGAQVKEGEVIAEIGGRDV
jgi:3-methylcrotonyl-CoA carboxylase alpha subunit